MKTRKGKRRIRLAALGILAGLFTAVYPPHRVDGGVVGSPHDFSKTSLITKYQTTPLSAAGACSICHIPHNAVYGALWPRDLTTYDNALGMNGGNGGSTDKPNYRISVTVQCYDCHDAHLTTVKINDIPAYSGFETDHKPQNIAFGFSGPKESGVKDSGSTMKEDDPAGAKAGYYENNPPYAISPQTYYGANSSTGSPFQRALDNVTLAKTGGHYFKSLDPTTGSVYKGDKLPCNDCHDPHAWDSQNRDWQAFFRPAKLYGYPTRTGRWNTFFSSRNPSASSWMANPVMSGESARSDSESRKMCILCHGDSTDYDAVTFNEISSAYTSTQKIVRPPASVGEHAWANTVACVSCHEHNSIGANCSQCHGFPPSDTASPAYPLSPRFVPSAPVDNDSHPRHYGKGSGARASIYEIGCETCHYGSYGPGSSMGYHQDNLVSVILQGGWTSKGSGYDNANYYNRDATLPPAYTGSLDNSSNKVNSGGWGNGSRLGGNTCRNVYCHSAGRDPSSMSPGNDNEYRRPTWNAGQQRCNDCHGYGTDNATNNGIYFGMPDYPTGSAGSTSANSHRKHIEAGYDCYVCHAATVDNNYTGPNRRILATAPTKHVNRVREVVFDGIIAMNGTRNPAYDNSIGGKSCSVSCHGSALPQWGGALANGCFDCHNGTEQTYKPRYDYGTSRSPNPVDNGQYLSSGHGLLRTGSYPGPDNNTGAGFSSAAIDNSSDCYYCHSRTAAHGIKNASDPFRLGYGSDAAGQKNSVAQGAFADNTDALCLSCHGTQAGWPRATKSSTQNMATHSKAITGGARSWPVTPWKCVDCHDPHGDTNWMMVRSGINAPNSSTDAEAGSDTQSVTKRTDSNVKAISFASAAGYADNSYAVPGTTNWGICEVCHWQTTAFSRTLDNAASHATRTNRCVSCHPHGAGFAAKACKGCHGGDNGDSGQVSGNAPNITKYWKTSGHGKTSSPAMNLECEACHDVGYRTAADHKTDGSVPNNPPNNINTEHWPNKDPLDNNTNPNVNTAHLKAAYFKTSPASRAEIAITFDNFCATACHKKDYHRHCKPNSCPDGAVRFGDQNTVPNPKAYSWYTQGTYVDTFYMSRSPWADNDISLVTGLPDASSSFAACVSCHDPHGTAVTDNSSYTFFSGTAITNHMVRGKWKTDTDNFCNRACHTNRTPP